MSKLLKEQWQRLAFGEGNKSINETAIPKSGGPTNNQLLKESHEIAAAIWANNGEGTDWGQDLLDALNRAQSSSHLASMASYNEDLKDTMRDMDHECEMNNVSTATVLGWIRQNNCPDGLDDWYSPDPNEPGAYKRKYGFFDG